MFLYIINEDMFSIPLITNDIKHFTLFTIYRYVKLFVYNLDLRWIYYSFFHWISLVIISKVKEITIVFSYFFFYKSMVRIGVDT